MPEVEVSVVGICLSLNRLWEKFSDVCDGSILGRIKVSRDALKSVECQIREIDGRTERIYGLSGVG